MVGITDASIVFTDVGVVAGLLPCTTKQTFAKGCADVLFFCAVSISRVLVINNDNGNNEFF